MGQGWGTGRLLCQLNPIGGPSGRTCPSEDPGRHRSRAGPGTGGRVTAAADRDGRCGFGCGGHRGCSLVRPQPGETLALVSPHVLGAMCIFLQTLGPSVSIHFNLSSLHPRTVFTSQHLQDSLSVQVSESSYLGSLGLMEAGGSVPCSLGRLVFLCCCP